MGRFRKGTLDHDGDGRMGGSRKGSDMTTKNAKPKTKAAPKEKAEDEKDALQLAAYETGRRARKSAIARNQAPHGSNDKLLSDWQEGWDFEDSQRGDTVEDI